MHEVGIKGLFKGCFLPGLGFEPGPPPMGGGLFIWNFKQILVVGGCLVSIFSSPGLIGETGGKETGGGKMGGGWVEIVLGGFSVDSSSVSEVESCCKY